jgi:isopentenyl-diphosphate delta-isomerase
MNESLVVHVNAHDEVLGFYPKMMVHEKAMLHRAVSVLIFNSKGDWLLQKRAKSKYHSGGLWTNTCCSHPYPNEDIKVAAERRLTEEMGMHLELKKSFDFVYKKELNKGLTEHEFDHVFVGYSDELPKLNTDEAEDWAYLTSEELLLNINVEPESYTEWFKILFPLAEKKFKRLKKVI